MLSIRASHIEVFHIIGSSPPDDTTCTAELGTCPHSPAERHHALATSRTRIPRGAAVRTGLLLQGCEFCRNV